MKTIFLVGIGFTFLSLIVLFVVPNALAGFHVFGGGDSKALNDASDFDQVNPDNVEELAEQYYGIYTSVIDDMLSYQKDPDYNRAEAQRKATVTKAEELIPRFKALARSARNKLDQLNEQALATPQPDASK